MGCGTGRGVGLLQERGFVALGLEPVAGMLRQAISKNQVTCGTLVCGAGEALPFRDGEFDVVFALGVLHHVKAPNDIVREMARVARKAVFLSDANRFGQGSLWVRWIKYILYKLNLWNIANFIKTKGKGYTFDEKGDGLSYSYSVYD